MPLATGQVLNNRYCIVKLLGQGGFGAVYRAWDLTFERPCAIKENLDPSPAAEKQFAREARLLANLRHPNLPMVHDYFSIPGQGQYLVMDYIEGEDLQTMLGSLPNPLYPFPSGKGAGGIGLPESQVLPWIIQVCDALEYLHRQNPPVIHRDIKPANIRVNTKNQALLVDFGIAKAFDPSRVTTTGARAVTPGYSPLEQYGQGGTDARSDVYSLGATLYTLLTGITPPSPGDVLAQTAEAALPAGQVNPQVTAEVSQAIEKAMQFTPRQRYQSAAQFAQALKAAMQSTANTPAQTAPIQTVATHNIAPLAAAAMQPIPATTPVSISPVQRVTTVIAEMRRLHWGWFAGATGLLLIVIILLAGKGGLFSGKATEDQSTETAKAALALVSTTATPTITSSPTITETPTPTSTWTPEPSPTETPLPSDTPTPTMSLPVLIGTGMPQPPSPITVDNASQVVQLARWGRGEIFQVAYSPDGRLLGVATSIGFYIYDSLTLEERLFIESPEIVRSLSFSPDGNYLASAGEDRAIHLWRVSDGGLERTMEGHTSGVYSVVFSPDGQFLASGSWDHTARLWRVGDGGLERIFEGHTGPVRTVAYSPDGKFLASGSEDKTVRLWRTADGGLERTMEGHTEPVHSVVFSPDGGWLASGGGDRTVRTWRVSDGGLERTFEGHTGTVYSVTFSPDGSKLASASEDKTVRIWRGVDGGLEQTMEGHTSPVTGVDFSPDGALLASGSADTTIRQWRVKGGGVESILIGHTAVLNSVAFSPDGQLLATSSDEG